jgi:Transmembrane domain of unknown function (DUF3566)
VSSSEQGNRQGAAPPRVTGAATAAATSAATAAAGRAPLAPAPAHGSNGASASSTTTYGASARTTDPSGRSEATGGEWASAAPSVPARSAPRSNPGPPPASAHQPGPMYGSAAVGGGPRSVRLTVAGLDPWSVLKLSFLLSVAIGIAMVIASVVLWSVLNGMGVFDQINRVALDITGTENRFNIYKYVGLGRVVSLSTVLGVVNVVLMTALSTLGAFLYNLGSGLVGGLHVTLTDD